MNDTLQVPGSQLPISQLPISQLPISQLPISQPTVAEQSEILFPVGISDDPRQTVLQQASERFQKAPDWVAFFREVLGVGGVIRRMFPQADDLLAFEQSPEYSQVQQMLAKLRERKEDPNSEIEPTRVITVRLPKSVHEFLKAEAHDRRTSMNKLCISKLLQMIDNELVPGD